MATREEVYEAIDSERKYQDERWAEMDRKHGGPQRTIDEWILYMQRYITVAIDETVTGDEAAAMETVRKITTMGVVAMEQHGAPKRQ